MISSVHHVFPGWGGGEGAKPRSRSRRRVLKPLAEGRAHCLTIGNAALFPLPRLVTAFMPKMISYGDLPNHVGQVLGPSRPFTITQEMIDTFADTTNDHQWVHVDVERAGREIGGTIAHGYLVLSLIPQFTAQLLVVTGVDHGLNYGLGRVRFTAPVPASSRLVATQEIIRAEPKGAGTLFTSTVAISIAGHERPACVAETMVLLFPGSGQV